MPKKSKSLSGGGSGFFQQKKSKPSAENGSKSTTKGVLQGGGKPAISSKSPQTVSFNGGYKKGSVVVDQSQKKLYYVLGNGKAYAYPVAVGKKGFKWTGAQKVSQIKDWPDWVPPAEMRQRKPNLPEKMMGGINNPLGAKAIYLGNSLYRIHGTDAPWSVGQAVSHGCIRMYNQDVADLYQRVPIGARVVVTW